MEINENKQGNVVLLDVRGRLDASTAANLESKIMGLIAGGERHIVLDCAQLDYVSSAGLRVLLIAAKKLATTNGKMAISSLKDHIKEVFDLAGFTDIFALYSSPEEAITGVG